ncbi:MAG: hypothetical protein EOP48_05255 [Sphingobacteriales bacterium]|nr:MAG: hypothetical protein EOP48_05255 [Sphingobacteriales bacterium]
MQEEKRIIRTIRKLIDNENEMCKHCGWLEDEQCHAQYAGYAGCKYMETLYDIRIDEEGEVVWKLKKSARKILEQKQFDKHRQSFLT